MNGVWTTTPPDYWTLRGLGPHFIGRLVIEESEWDIAAVPAVYVAYWLGSWVQEWESQQRVGQP